MNCCDEYGNCRQGRDCPVRIERLRQAKERLDAEEREDWLGTALSVAAAALMVLVIVIVLAMSWNALR